MMNSFPSVGRVLLARQFAVLGKIAMTVLFTVVFLGVQAQERQVTGKVKDGTGTGMPGVTVAVKGTQRGTSTDVDGNYKDQV